MSTFAQMPLKENIIRTLEEKYKFTEPTLVQKQVFAPFSEGKNILVQSETGSGKTFAYLLPLDHMIDSEKKELQAIILSPSHELAVQITHVNEELAKDAELNIKTQCLIGEANINKQIERLKDKPQIIVGTPGRILDLFKKRKLNGQTVRTIVLDEVDQLLDNTNCQNVLDIIKSTRRNTQICAFSASVSDSTKNMLSSLREDIENIALSSKTYLNNDITHYYIVTPQREKADTLRSLVHALENEKILVFTQNGRNIELVAEKLQYHKINAQALHSALPKEDRKEALEGFRKGTVRVLVSSDLAARGLDIADVGYVVNLDFPRSALEYVHRAGRTGRMGKKGNCISLVTSEEVAPLRIYKREFALEMSEIHLYGGKIYPGAAKGKSRPPKKTAQSPSKASKTKKPVKGKTNSPKSTTDKGKNSL